MQLPRDLFNAAFVSCWTEIPEHHQQELIRTLEQALMVPDLPEIIQTILNLAEFMEHCDKGPLPLDPQILGEKAMQCRAYAKALHYKEEEFYKEPTSQVVEALISINNKLQQREAAMGLLEYARNHECEHLKVEERWYEKLHDWEKALDAYHEKLQENPHDIEFALGKMRCMEALGDWEQLQGVACKHWNQVDESGRERMSRMAAASAWGLEQWENVEKYVQCIAKDTMDGSFYRAVLSIHNRQYDVAKELIESSRDLLDAELTSMAGESYQRAYPAMVSVQMLAELEEVIQYDLFPQRRPVIRNMWWKRLQGCQRVVEDWQKIIQVRTLVVSPQEDMYTWLKYASLCRKSGRLTLSHKTLVMLMGTDPSVNVDQPLPTNFPQVTYAYTKHLWTSGEKKRAYRTPGETNDEFHQKLNNNRYLYSKPNKATMTCPKEIISPCVGNDVNHFSGVLPCHHNEAGCHRESTKRKKIFIEMKKLLDKMETLPRCEEWDTSKTMIPTKGEAKGPYRIGEYDKTHGKPWDLNRVPSRELVGGILVPSCDCMKRNGLQDDCRRTQCKGKPWCLTEPWPDCPPFTKIPKEWVDEDPLLMCPNYHKPAFTGPADIANPQISGDHFKVGSCRDGLYSFTEVPAKHLPAELQNNQGPLYRCEGYNQ